MKWSEIKSNIQADLRSDIDEMNERLGSLMDSGKYEENINLDVVIHNLPETQGEKTENKVSALLREGVKG